MIHFCRVVCSAPTGGGEKGSPPPKSSGFINKDRGYFGGGGTGPPPHIDGGFFGGGGTGPPPHIDGTKEQCGDAIQFMCKLKEVFFFFAHASWFFRFETIIPWMFVTVHFVVRMRSSRVSQCNVAQFFSYPAFPLCWLCHLVDVPSQVCRRRRAPPQTGLQKLMRQADCLECDCLVLFTCASSSFGGTARHFGRMRECADPQVLIHGMCKRVEILGVRSTNKVQARHESPVSGVSLMPSSRSSCESRSRRRHRSRSSQVTSSAEEVPFSHPGTLEAENPQALL